MQNSNWRYLFKVPTFTDVATAKPIYGILIEQRTKRWTDPLTHSKIIWKQKSAHILTIPVLLIYIEDGQDSMGTPHSDDEPELVQPSVLHS